MKIEKPLNAALIVMGVALIVGLPCLIYPFGDDQGLYAYIADRWIHGGRPYSFATNGGFDVKPPGIFLVYAVAQMIFGHSELSIRLLDLILTTAASGLMFALAKRLGWSTALAMLASVIFSATYWGSFNFWHSAQCESFAAPLTIGYVLILLTGEGRARSSLLAGVLLGMMMVLKTTFAPFALLVFAVPDFRSRFWRAAPVFVAGVAIPLVAMVSYFAYYHETSNLLEMFRAQAEYARGQAIAVPGRLLPRATGFLWRAPALAVLLVGSGVEAVRQVRERKHNLLLFLWLSFALLILLIQGRLYDYHWIPLLPPAALLTTSLLASGRHRAILIAAGSGILILKSGPWLGSAPAAILALAGVVAAVLQDARERNGHLKLALLLACAFCGLAMLSGLLPFNWLVLFALLTCVCTPLFETLPPSPQLAVLTAPAAVFGLWTLTCVGSAVLVATGHASREDYWDTCKGGPGFSYRENNVVADYIAHHSRPTDTILVYTFEPSIYFDANRIAPTRQIYINPFAVETQIKLSMREGWRRELVSACEANPPAWIVTPSLPDRRKTHRLLSGLPIYARLGRLHYVLLQDPSVVGFGKFCLFRLTGKAPSPADALNESDISTPCR